MLAESPAPAPPPHATHKRKRTDADGAATDDDGDDNDDDELPVIPSSEAPTGDPSESNGNMVAFGRRYATHRRLKPSQITEVEAFAADSVATRQVKLFALVLGVNSKLDAIVAAKPAFKVSLALDKNLRQLAHGVTISSKLASYKGNSAKKHLLNIVKKNRFDLPPGIEFIASDWGLVKSSCRKPPDTDPGRVQKMCTCSVIASSSSLILTQFLFIPLACLVIYTQLKASMPAGPATDHINIFVLGQSFVKDTETVLTIELCSRIALMRQQYKLYPGDNFWDQLDNRLAWLRKTSNYDETKITRAFKAILNDDRSSHGKTADYTLPEDAVIDTWQLSVDTSIVADADA
ncbi:hypothetical protein C8R43DRAFT_1125762 [Mycena crocata]|nr:hypothetical protein C8R43DRAFT_1125762 [Mycena crocata]